jgi:hypothetical protein
VDGRSNLWQMLVVVEGGGEGKVAGKKRGEGGLIHARCDNEKG